MTTKRFLGLVGVICLLALASPHTLAGVNVPVRWTRSIYAPSYGLDDKRVVTRQSQFAELYTRWTPPVQFNFYLTRVTKPVTFHSCDDILQFVGNNKIIDGLTDLDRLRLLVQVSNCRIWKLMPTLKGSSVSYLPDIIGGKNADVFESVRFFRELARKIAREKATFKNPFLRDFRLDKGWYITCDVSSECGYEVPEDDYESIGFSTLAQGDYNGDGINDFFVSMFAAQKKNGYIGLVITRTRKGGPLEIIGEF